MTFSQHLFIILYPLFLLKSMSKILMLANSDSMFTYSNKYIQKPGICCPVSIVRLFRFGLLAFIRQSPSMEAKKCADYNYTCSKRYEFKLFGF